MKIVLSGTAGPHGHPEPGCPCASCLTLPGGHRRPAEVLVDGRPLSPGSHVLGGARLLFEPDAALPDGAGGGPYDVVPDGAAGGPYDVVLLDLLGRPERLGELRRAGMVAEGAQVVAVGLDHRVRSEEELGRRLELWGARAVPDGTVLDLPGPARVPHPRRTLLLGGSRSGKSAEAELRLAAEPHVTYVATGPSGAGDGEWAARVRAHRERRPAHWATAETTDLAGTIAAATTPLLVDGLGTWVAAVFDEHGAWEGPREPVRRRCDELVEAWRRTPVAIVAVSDEVGLGVVPATASGRAFRDVLGKLNERLAAESEYVALVVAGRPLPL
ncbi:bifunctional adenosylcobinamide kinase/adenosylcobinamide-phosphate guanylyltransferase [Nonomuraea sp. NPDC059007]|uniref:bifunctional adenosylcobinamide kinase/adenosylcobinamide-phosphate guanylyltransferase n=1 Tax=Nonomuraea sp. NPDC059007 TaxID=3346692 RepID=UPI0036A76BDF